jgi:hypothetical protein
MKRNTWFRAYSEALDDPKVQRLHPTLFKAWFNLLCLASQHDGVLPSNDDIAFRLRVSVQDAQGYIDELILVGLIDIRSDGARTPHNWETRQFVSDTSTERVRKHRKRKQKTEGNVDETFQATPPEQSRSETDTENSPPLPPIGGMAGADFQSFRKRLETIAGEALADPANSPSLINPSPIAAWIESGADPELDIVPAVQSVAARSRPRSIRSWEYFTRQVAENKARRAGGFGTVIPAAASDHAALVARELREIRALI